MSSSSSTMTIPFKRHFAISVAVRLELNSFADGFNSFFPILVCCRNTFTVQLQWIQQLNWSIDYNIFPIRNWATRMVLPFPIYNAYFPMSLIFLFPFNYHHHHLCWFWTFYLCVSGCIFLFLYFSKDHLESESDSQIFVVNRLLAPVVKYYFNKLFPIKPIPTVLFQ